jgi:tetratricopeptide (TPR) repeat protein
MKLLFYVLMVLFTVACQPTVHMSKPSSEALAVVLAGEALFSEGVPDDYLPEDEPLKLTPSMITFVENNISPGVSEGRRLQQLIAALFSADALNIRYEENVTFTAALAFENQSANCLSFTMLFGALAEHIGLDVFYNEVDVPPTWDVKDDNRLIRYKHVNAIVDIRKNYGLRGAKKVIDINYENYDPSYRQAKITRRHLEAQYYNNKAVEYLAAGELERSFLYLRKSLQKNMDSGYVWGNLGVLHRALGDSQLAKTALEMALYLDATDMTAMSNLAKVYQDLNLHQAAEEMVDKIRYARDRNPYYHYSLAISAYNANEMDDALARVESAIRLYDKDHRFFFLKAKALVRMGHIDKGMLAIDKARDVALDPAQQGFYASKLDRFASIRGRVLL